MSSRSFLTELFDPDSWPMRFFHPASCKARCWLNFEFIHFTSHPQCYIPWFPWSYACVACKILSSLRDCYDCEKQIRIFEWLLRRKKAHFLFFLSLKSTYTILVWSVTCGIISFYHYALKKLFWGNCFGVFWCKWNISILIEFL